MAWPAFTTLRLDLCSASCLSHRRMVRAGQGSHHLELPLYNMESQDLGTQWEFTRGELTTSLWAVRRPGMLQQEDIIPGRPHGLRRLRNYIQ